MDLFKLSGLQDKSMELDHTRPDSAKQQCSLLFVPVLVRQRVERVRVEVASTMMREPTLILLHDSGCLLVRTGASHLSDEPPQREPIDGHRPGSDAPRRRLPLSIAPTTFRPLHAAPVARQCNDRYGASGKGA
jgi:hypothetical protein